MKHVPEEEEKMPEENPYLNERQRKL